MFSVIDVIEVLTSSSNPIHTTSKTEEPETFEENLKVAKRGGGVAGIAREAAETQTGKPVITQKNALDFADLISNVIEALGFESEEGV